MPYGFGQQLPIVPPSLNDLNLPPNPFNILATMAVVHPIQSTHDDNYSPQSPEPSELSSISTPPMNVSAFNSWETSYTTTDSDTFHSSDEPRRVYWNLSSDDDLGSSVPRNPSVVVLPRRLQEHRKRNQAWECPFQKTGECRSTSAKPAVRRSPQQRTPQAHQAETRTVPIPNLFPELLN